MATLTAATPAELKSAISASVTGDTIELTTSGNYADLTTTGSDEYFIGKGITIKAAAGKFPFFDSNKTRNTCFSLYRGVNRVTLQGLVIRNYKKYGIYAERTPLTAINVVVDGINEPVGSTATQKERCGIFINNPDALADPGASLLTNVTLINCGAMGLKTNYAHGLVMDGCTVYGNNTEKYATGNADSEACGVKLVRSFKTVVKNCNFYGQNAASCLWIDVKNNDFIISGCNFTKIFGGKFKDKAIHLEISETGIVVGNRITNYFYGIMNDMTGDVEICNNTLFNNIVNLYFKESYNRDAEPGIEPNIPPAKPRNSNIRVYNNLVQGYRCLDVGYHEFHKGGTTATHPMAIFSFLDNNAYDSVDAKPMAFNIYGSYTFYDLTTSTSTGWKAKIATPAGRDKDSLFSNKEARAV